MSIPDGVQAQPRIPLEPAEQAGQTGPAAEAADVQLLELHLVTFYVGGTISCREQDEGRLDTMSRATA